MKPAEWIRKHKVVWQRWPSLQELRQQFQWMEQERLAVVLQRVKQAK